MQLLLGGIMPQLYIVVGESLIPIGVLFIFIAEMQLVILVLLENWVDIPELVKEEVLAVLKFYQLLVLGVADRDAFWEDRTNDTQFSIEGFSENNGVGEVLVVNPVLMILIVANMFSQKENASTQESNVKEENFEILAIHPLYLW